MKQVYTVPTVKMILSLPWCLHLFTYLKVSCVKSRTEIRSVSKPTVTNLI